MSDTDIYLELRDCFLEEAQQSLAGAEQLLLGLELESEDKHVSSVNALFRIAHNLKGSSKSVDFNSFADFIHDFESCLTQIQWDSPLKKHLKLS